MTSPRHILLFCMVLPFLGLISGQSASLMAQNNDSLVKVFLDRSQPDSIRLSACDDISNSYLFSQPDSAIYWCEKGLETSTSINQDKWKATFYNTIGLANYIKSEFPAALDAFQKSLTHWETSGKKKGMAKCLGNIGLVFQSQGDLNRARAYQQRALDAFREIGDKKGTANTLGNIANIQDLNKDVRGSLGTYLQALALFYEVKFPRGIHTTELNVADNYFYLKLYDSSRYYLDLCIPSFEKDNNAKALSSAYSLLGRVLVKQNKPSEGLSICEKGLALSEKVGNRYDEKNNCFCIAEAYEKSGKLQMALDYFKRFKNIEDSLNDEETTRRIAQTEMQFVYDRKAAQDSLRHAERQKVAKAELEKERTQKFALYGGLALTIVFSVFLFNRMRLIRDQKRTIEEQKLKVEEKNKEVMDSIHYAKRIQMAILKEEEHVSEHLPPHFILLKPKDVVSGDFYWAFEKGDWWYVAAADCTGHGVPGAFLTMLGTAILNEIVQAENRIPPGEILNILREKLVNDLGQSGRDGNTKDGMDISLVCVNRRTMQGEWAGANNPLWIFHEDKAKQTLMSPDKQPIGYYEKPVPFTTHEFQLKQHDLIVLFTDGYADQFGGPRGKKFKYKNLMELIESNKHESPETLKEILYDTFENWRAWKQEGHPVQQLEQVDDVCVIGIRV